MKGQKLLKRVLVIGGALFVLAACSPEKDQNVRRKKGNIEEARRNIEEASNEELKPKNLQAEEGDVVVAEETEEAADLSSTETVSAPEVKSDAEISVSEPAEEQTEEADVDSSDDDDAGADEPSDE